MLYLSDSCVLIVEIATSFKRAYNTIGTHHQHSQAEAHDDAVSIADLHAFTCRLCMDVCREPDVTSRTRRN